ncbi:MAG: ParB/Srx family N-terminal domain-containing protein, partial [Phycisphaerales bacterium]|nr:ParB/Srx family N-terminal domain-containing protein [Phycisphaerales bacterium]
MAKSTAWTSRVDDPVERGEAGSAHWDPGPWTITRQDRGPVDPRLLVSLPGKKDEHTKLKFPPGRRTAAGWRELVDSLRKGFDATNPVLVIKETNGDVFIYEGNHRVRAAIEAGLPTITVEIRYMAGSQRGGKLVIDPKTGQRGAGFPGSKLSGLGVADPSKRPELKDKVFCERCTSRHVPGRHDSGVSGLGSTMGDVAAYHERVSPATGGPVRHEWRVRPLTAWTYAELDAAWGTDWRTYRPGAEFVLEERYIRDGVDEGWKPFQAANTEEQALQDVPQHHGVVAVDSYLIELWALRAQAEQSHHRAVSLKEEREYEARERGAQKKRSEDAFERMRTGKSGKGAEWAEKWNAFIQAHVDDAAYRGRAAADATYMALYKAVFAAETVPTKQKAIREFLAYAQKAGLGAATAARGLAALGGAALAGKGSTFRGISVDQRRELETRINRASSPLEEPFSAELREVRKQLPKDLRDRAFTYASYFRPLSSSVVSDLPVLVVSVPGKPWSVLVADRALTLEELYRFELTPLFEAQGQFIIDFAAALQKPVELVDVKRAAGYSAAVLFKNPRGLWQMSYFDETGPFGHDESEAKPEKLVYEAWQRGYRVFRPGTVDEWAPNFDPKLLENISRKGGPISGLSSL